MVRQVDMGMRLERMRKDIVRAYGREAETLRDAVQRLPASLRVSMGALLDAEAIAGHPKYRQLLDPREIDQAEARLRKHLRMYRGRRLRPASRMEQVALVIVMAFLGAGGLYIWTVTSGSY